MKWLFIHQNFPGQFVHVVRYLARAGHDVNFITQPRKAEIEGVRKFEYRPPGARLECPRLPARA